MPSQEQLPSGPLRELIEALHRLYRDAGTPSTRTISRESKADDGALGSPSHDTVASILRGQSLKWENVQAIVRTLAARSHLRPDLGTEVSRFHQLWDDAERSATTTEVPSPVEGVELPADFGDHFARQHMPLDNVGEPVSSQPASKNAVHPGSSQDPDIPQAASGELGGPYEARIPWHRRRLAVAVAVAVVVIVMGAGMVGAWSIGGDEPGDSEPSGSALAPCTEPATTVRIVSSTDKSAILKELAQTYGARSSHGQCVEVVVDSIDSGTAMQALAGGWRTAAGAPQPDVWSPASQVWLQIAHHRASAQVRDPLPSSAGEPIVTSPLTIAMPEPIAKDLGLLGKKISWQDLAELASNPGFKLGKTNPGHSTSGLNATFASFYAQTGTADEMTTANLEDQSNQEKVRAIEKSVVHYGDTTLTYLANLRRYDDAGQATTYVSAVTVEENSVIAYNKGYPCGSRSEVADCAKTTPPRTKLVAFHPANEDGVGTMYSDHPYITLNGLPDAKKEIAADFQRFLTSKTAQDKFADLGFRTPSGDPTTDDGTQPDQLPGPLGQPSDEVLDRMLTVWRQLRKPANVLLLIDTSGSMNQNSQDKEPRLKDEPSKLDLVKKAHGALLDGFTDTDKVGLWHFSDYPVTDKDPAPMRSRTTGGKTQRQHLEASIAALKPDAGTALYGTIDAAVKNLRDHYDKNAINAVVVLTDGKNQIKDGPGLEGLTKTLGDPDQPAVRVFTIAYGGEATRDELQEIAKASNARAYDAADPNSINEVLTNVISNF